VGLLGNAAEILPEMVRRGIRPDALTDQTSAHDPVNGYLPLGWTVEQWIEMRERDPKAVEQAARASMAVHVEAMLAFRTWACRPSTMATTSGRSPETKASSMPSISRVRARLCAAAFLPRDRAVPLVRAFRRSGGYLPHRRQGEGADPRRPPPPPLAGHGARAHRVPGLPARICWVGLGQRHRLGLAFNDMVRSGELKAPVVIGRDHLDSGSVASPNRETRR
jgi:urocanate hydratase